MGPLSVCTVATLYTLMELIRHADADVSRQIMLTSIPNLVVSYDDTIEVFHYDTHLLYFRLKHSPYYEYHVELTLHTQIMFQFTKTKEEPHNSALT